MRVTPGTRLAHYEILSAIGKGGLGEVWRARHDARTRSRHQYTAWRGGKGLGRGPLAHHSLGALEAAHGKGPITLIVNWYEQFVEE